jgi:tripartite ATP-independent transporter DctP family solute receptor
MKRRVFLGAMASTIALPFVARGQGARELRFASVNPTGSVQDKGLQLFKETVESGTNGAITVNVYPNGQLGDLGQMASGLQLGTIDLALYGFGNLAPLDGGQPVNVAFVPYLCKSKAAAQQVLGGPIFEPVFEDVANKSGIRTFAVAGARSPRAVNTTKGPIEKPADLSGFRIRVPPIELAKATFEALGCSTVGTGISEVYLALSRGQIDGQDNGFDLSLQFKFPEVAKFWSATDHVYEFGIYCASETLWQQLTPAEQDVFRQAGQAAGNLITQLTEELDATGMRDLQAQGVQFTTPDLDAFRSALADVHKPYEGKLFPEGMVDRIRASQA